MDKLSSNHKKILLLVALIILGILIYKIYTNYTTYTNQITIGKEGFTSTNGIATDLLTKLKSYEAQTTNATNPADLELSIYPWTTKLYNLQTQNQVKPIGLYKPHLSINGVQYAKLGDMITQHADYSPPDNKETTLLIAKVGSDIKPPTDYTQIVSMGNANLPNYYYQLNTLIVPNMAISSVVKNLQSCVNSISNLEGVLKNNNQSILDGIKNLVGSSAQLQIGTASPINLATLASMPSSGPNGIIAVNITHTTKIVLPAGVACAVMANVNGTEQVLGEMNFGAGLNYSQIQTAQTVLNAIGNIAIQNLSAENIIINTYQINAFAYVKPQDVIDFLNDLCNNILAVLNLPGLSQEFSNYLNLADSIDGVNKVLAAISTLSPSSAVDSNGNKINIIAANNFLHDYATTNSGTLLGGILNLIMKYTKTISFPSIKFTADSLAQTNITNSINTTNFNNIVASANLFMIKSVNPNILDTVDINLSSDEKQLPQAIVSNNIPNLSNLILFDEAITSNQLSYFPLQIYAPVAPSGYQSLGHIFCNVPRDLTKIKTMNNIACVPSGCVKEVRDWVPADKVFEYNQDGIYWALFKNPYIGTFIAINQPGVPAGKVCKVVACVSKCTAVDELKKADKCARTYQSINNSISSKLTALPDLVASTEEDIYLQQIKTQNDNIISLENRARQLQTDIDKADIITAEMNKAKLQNYVDTQKRNIELVADRLEKDINKVQVNINIPVQALNQLITTITNLPNIPPAQKTAIINKIINNAQAANQGLLTSGQYNSNLNNILKSCPQYDLTGLVKKSLVGDVCYGCGTPA